MQKQTPRFVISTSVKSQKAVERIDGYARELGLTRSRLIKAALEYAYKNRKGFTKLVKKNPFIE